MNNDDEINNEINNEIIKLQTPPIYIKLQNICKLLLPVERRLWQIIQDDERIVSVLAQLHPQVDITVSHWLLGDTVTVINIRTGKYNSEWRVDWQTNYAMINMNITVAINTTTQPVKLFSQE